MQFCVKNMVILNSLYLEKSLRYVYQTWLFDCWYLNLINNQNGYHSNQSCGRGNQKWHTIITNQIANSETEDDLSFSPNFIR